MPSFPVPRTGNPPAPPLSATKVLSPRRRHWKAGIVLLVVAAIAVATPLTPAFAVEPDEILTDPTLESRARGISAGLRCLVCQNQSIDDSHAPLARDLRLLVRERLAAGDNDRAVLDFVVARYGEFVLLRPPLNTGTLILWLSPVLLLVAAAGLLISQRNRSQDINARHSTEPPLTPDELKRLDEILRKDG